MSQLENNQAFSTLTSRCCVLGWGGSPGLTITSPNRVMLLKLRNHSGDAKAGELSPPAALLYANQQAERPTPLLGDWERGSLNGLPSPVAGITERE